jgi:hypothetical protein
MDALLVNAGSWASISGVVISTVGLIATIYVAWGARSASRAARAAATATNNRIENYLQSVDLERAIALIQRIKLLHDTGRWEAALEQYQSLRMMLSGIIARTPEEQPELRDKLGTARAIVTAMENSVRNSIRQGDEAPDWPSLDESLNDIQSTLEELASTMGFGKPSEEPK